jgi:type II secretory pathway pseudopilin PulG
MPYLLKKKNACWLRGNEAAFTLIELLVVCLLLSITMAVSIPALRDSLLTDQLKAASRKIIGAVRELREEALRDRRAFMLYIDMGEKRLWYEKDDEQDPEKRMEARKQGLVLPSSIRILDVWTKSDGRQVEGTVGLWISRLGYMDQTVIHVSDGSETQSIRFAPFLGSIEVVDGYANLE